MLNTNLSRKSGLPFGLTYTQIAGAGLLLLCASPLPVQAVGATSIYSEIVQQTGKINAGLLNHTGKLPHGQNRIHILHAVLSQLGTGRLEFFSGTGHDRYHINLLGINPVLLGILALEHRAQHFVG